MTNRRDRDIPGAAPDGPVGAGAVTKGTAGDPAGSRLGHAHRKVLFVSYHFPPDANIGGVRTAKFVKYLQQMGWQPIVVTLALEQVRAVDEGRLADVQQVQITRVPAWRSPMQAVLSLRDRLVGRGRSADDQEVHRERGAGEPVCRPPKGGRRLVTAAGRLIGSVLELPDRQIGWLVPAAWAAFRIMRREEIRVVVTSSPPRTTALVGLLLAVLTRVAVITDLRDPWFTASHKSPELRSWLSDRLESWLERLLVRYSRTVVTTTEGYRDLLDTLYPSAAPSRFVTIWNGYDGDDFGDPQEPPPGCPVRISYLGTFYFGRSPKGFLTGLRRFLDIRGLGADDVAVEFVGEVGTADGLPVQAMIDEMGLAHIVRLRGSVPYREAVAIMHRSHALLLFAPRDTHDLAIPAKTFEYIAARRHVLCLSEGGPAAEFVRSLGIGEVAGQDEADAIAAALDRLYLRVTLGQGICPSVDVRRFDRRRLAAELGALLEAAVRT